MQTFKLKSALCMLAMTSAMQSWAADTSLNGMFNMGQDCQVEANSVSSFGAALGCGAVHGAVKTLYYSTNNAYFVEGLNQDTVSMGAIFAMKQPLFMGCKPR